MKNLWKFACSKFVDWIRLDFEFAFRNLKFKMVERNFEKFPIFMKICIWEFSRLLIKNPLSDFENSIWPFQCDSGFVISDPKTA